MTPSRKYNAIHSSWSIEPAERLNCEKRCKWLQHARPKQLGSLWMSEETLQAAPQLIAQLNCADGA